MLASEKLLLRALRGETLVPPPIWLMRQAGRYLPEYREVRKRTGNFLELCYTPELAVEVTLQPIRRYGFDAAIIFSDILVVPDALGQGVAFHEGKGPVLEALQNAGDVKKLVWQEGKLDPVYDALRSVRRDLPEETALIGFAGAPWTLAAYMIEGGGSKDFAKATHWASAAPESFAELIRLLTESIAHHLIRQIEAGAEALQIFDSWAGKIPASQFERICLEPTRAIVEAVHKKFPDVPILGFPRGVGLSRYESYAEKSGVDGISIDASISPKLAAAKLQPHVCVQGNLDPKALIAGGAAMGAGVAEILQGLGGGPFVFNLGHGVDLKTPPDHVAELVALVREGATG